MNVYGLLGNPVEHSLSPPMHEAAYEARNLDARYVTFEPAESDLADAIAGAAALGIAGLNVTIPFKEAVLDIVQPDDLATRIGAVNTIDLTGEQPTGHNTDAAGVKRAFAHHGVEIAGKTAVMVGAGGAGRAAGFALADAGADVHIVNRTVARAAKLATELTSTTDVEATGSGLDALPGYLADADLLVNATSVGMESEESPVPADALHGDLAVLDAVYTPLRTRLLRDARLAGATTIDGAWMLLFQGAEAFERWTGMTAPVDAMNEALRAELE